MSSTYVGMAIWIIAALVAISTRRAWVRASVIVMMATGLFNSTFSLLVRSPYARDRSLACR